MTNHSSLASSFFWTSCFRMTRRPVCKHWSFLSPAENLQIWYCLKRWDWSLNSTKIAWKLPCPSIVKATWIWHGEYCKDSERTMRKTCLGRNKSRKASRRNKKCQQNSSPNLCSSSMNWSSCVSWTSTLIRYSRLRILLWRYFCWSWICLVPWAAKFAKEPTSNPALCL